MSASGTFGEIIRRVSRREKIDPRVVQFVARHQLRFIARHVIADPDVNRPYRALHWGLFAPKGLWKKSGVK